MLNRKSFLTRGIMAAGLAFGLPATTGCDDLGLSELVGVVTDFYTSSPTGSPLGDTSGESDLGSVEDDGFETFDYTESWMFLGW